MNQKLPRIISFLIVGFTIIIVSMHTNLMESSYNSTFKNNELRISSISSKIHINNNWTDAKAASICTGEGTAFNPYIIKDWMIDGEKTGNCILIENSSAFFIIKNCSITNSGEGFFDSGIKIYNSKYGLIINNFLYDNHIGIYLEGCNDTVITGNDCDQCIGVQIFASNNITVFYNNFVSGPILVSDFTYYNSTIQWNSNQRLSYSYNGQTFNSYIGNYFEDYDGQDANNNGIGDSPLVIDPHKPTPIIVDSYVLMEPIENYQLNVAGGIPGYNLLLFISVLCVSSLLLIKKFKKRL